MSLKIEYNSGTIAERILKLRVWCKRHFSWYRTNGWHEERYTFTISLTGEFAQWVKSWLSKPFDRAMQRDLANEIKAAGGVPSEFLGGLTTPGDPAPWPEWMDYPVGKITTPPIDHKRAAHLHSRPSR